MPEQAFLNAGVTIRQWEARDGLTPMERESAPAMTIRRAAVDVGPPGSSICAYPHSGNRYPLFRDMR